MKSTTKKYLLWGAGLYAAYYWYKNYGPGSPAAMAQANALANPAAANIAAASGQALMAQANAVYQNATGGV